MSGKTGQSSALQLVVVVLAMLAGLAAVYLTLGGRDNVPRRPDAAPAPSAAAGNASAPAPGSKLNVGEMAAFVFRKAPEPLPEVAFTDGAGAPMSLKAWQGRVVLLNLWATWCAPCRKEMPGLARLQQELGSPRFEVVALAVDRAGIEAARKFLATIEPAGLALYVDATARAGTALKAVGMPTTLLIDAEGREVGRLTGPAEWDSPEAKRLVQSLLR